MLPKVCIEAKLLSHLPKTIEFYRYIQVPNATSKNVSWPHFSWRGCIPIIRPDRDDTNPWPWPIFLHLCIVSVVRNSRVVAGG